MQALIDQQPVFVFFTSYGLVYHEAYDDPSAGFQGMRTLCSRKFSLSDAKRIFYTSPNSGFPDKRMCLGCIKAKYKGLDKQE